MASWREIQQEAAEFAAKVKERFEAGTNKTLATLRRDGAPRISGSEAAFQDGELTFGMMPGSVNLMDVRRDPRIAMHRPTSPAPGGLTAGFAGRRETGRHSRGDPGAAGRSGRRRRTLPRRHHRGDVDLCRRSTRPPGDRVLARGPRPQSSHPALRGRPVVRTTWGRVGRPHHRRNSPSQLDRAVLSTLGAGKATRQYSVWTRNRRQVVGQAALSVRAGSRGCCSVRTFPISVRGCAAPIRAGQGDSRSAIPAVRVPESHGGYQGGSGGEH